MKYRAGLFISLTVAIALLSSGGAGDPSPRDGRFGLSGITGDKCLPIDAARIGFYIGPSAGFIGSNKEELHTHRLWELGNGENGGWGKRPANYIDRFLASGGGDRLPIRLDLGFAPVYLIGQFSSLPTSPPELRSVDGS